MAGDVTAAVPMLRAARDGGLGENERRGDVGGGGERARTVSGDSSWYGAKFTDIATLV